MPLSIPVRDRPAAARFCGLLDGAGTKKFKRFALQYFTTRPCPGD